MLTATLHCGTVLSFEQRDFCPEPGEVVPCRHHGYCTVRRTGGRGSGGAREGRTRRRVESELADWLRGRTETTVHALRREGFTLRLLTVAERNGVVEVDLRAGRVLVRQPIDGSCAAAV